VTLSVVKGVFPALRVVTGLVLAVNDILAEVNLLMWRDILSN
jgi:hypothetical protein